MLFNSLYFAVFFTVLIILYYLIQDKFRWILLLIASSYFYYQSVPFFFVFLFFSIVTTYFCAKYIHHFSMLCKNEIESKDEISRSEKTIIKHKYDIKKKWILVITLVLILGVLVVFKYYNLFTIKVASYISLPILKIAMPLGISFYTFTTISYCIDIYREEFAPQKNIFKYALFVSYFPHIIQGPISNYRVLAPRLFAPKAFNYQNVVRGIYLFMWGLFKKTVIADRIAPFITEVYTYYDIYPNFILILAAILYSFQIYADFSGYIDMARGASRILGIELERNFLRPHFSKTMSEFWRRWHISLGAWFRNYLYYPLMRTKAFSNLSKYLRKKKLKQLSRKLPVVLALLITWILIGAWHGSNLKYIAFSLFHGGLIIVAFIFDKSIKNFNAKINFNPQNFWIKLFRVLRTFALTCIAYIFFRAPGPMVSLRYMYRMIVFIPNTMHSLRFLQAKDFTVLFFIITFVLIGIMLTVMLIQRKHSISLWVSNQNPIVRWTLYFVFFLVLIVCNKSFTASSSEFIYFKF